MKQLRVLLLLQLLVLGIVSCSPGHLGSNLIAFVRDGQLWTIDPNGANAFAIVNESTPVISYSWSPTHQLLSFRTLDAEFAQTSEAKHLPINSITGIPSDIPSTLNTLGVDGGTPISIVFSDPTIRSSHPIWNASGTRLMYRQTGQMPPARLDGALWWVAQNDQPAGIAAKALPGSYTIPSLSYDNNNPMAIGNANKGLFTTTLAGTNLRYLSHEPLAGHPLPASLERVLWQPAHQNPTLLYAITTTQQASNTAPFTVQLMQRSMENEQAIPLTSCACTQFAWSPDGNHIIYSTGTTYTILSLKDNMSFKIEGEENSVPYWSPDSQFLLLDGLHQLILVKNQQQQQSTLLNDTSSAQAPLGSTAPTLPLTNALLQPAPNNIWSADSRHFLFLTRNRLLWQGKQLNKGLYTISIDASGQPQSSPVLVDGGNDTQAGWTYQDANTSFLF